MWPEGGCLSLVLSQLEKLWPARAHFPPAASRALLSECRKHCPCENGLDLIGLLCPVQSQQNLHTVCPTASVHQTLLRLKHPILLESSRQKGSNSKELQEVPETDQIHRPFLPSRVNHED